MVYNKIKKEKKMLKRLLGIGVVLLVGAQANAILSTVPVTLATANAVTAWEDIRERQDIVFEYTVESMGTEVVMRHEGGFMVDDVIRPYNLDDLEVDRTITATGNYMDHKNNFGGRWIRTKLVSFTGDTPNVTAVIKGKRN